MQPATVHLTACKYAAYFVDTGGFLLQPVLHLWRVCGKMWLVLLKIFHILLKTEELYLLLYYYIL